MAKKKSGIVKAVVGIGAVVVAGKVAYEKYKTTKSRYTKEEQDSADLEVRNSEKFKSIARFSAFHTDIYLLVCLKCSSRTCCWDRRKE